jgi:hypothetical protein
MSELPSAEEKAWLAGQAEVLRRASHSAVAYSDSARPSPSQARKRPDQGASPSVRITISRATPSGVDSSHSRAVHSAHSASVRPSPRGCSVRKRASAARSASAERPGSATGQVDSPNAITPISSQSPPASSTR